MTLAEFLAIFLTRRKLIFTLILAALLLSIAAYRLQIQSYDVSVVVSVTRSSPKTTIEYEYDHFYRLQADERFADTLVRYLGTAQGKRSIASRADLSSSENAFFLGGKVQATRLSSQLVVVTLPSRTLRGGERLAIALPEALNQYATELNEPARDENWFSVIASEPVIADARFSWREALLIGFLIGCFTAFWVALLDQSLRPRPTHQTSEHLRASPNGSAIHID